MPLKGTLSGSYNAPVTLDNGAYANPVTVTGTVSLASTGVDLASSSAWSVVNAGSILGAGSSASVGVQFAGEIAVEHLRPGMRVVSLTHRRALLVRWIGSRTVERAAVVRIAAGAFGNGAPHDSLHVSSDHAVFVHGALVPIRFLVNGASIVEIAGGEVTYFHVELAEHGVLLAEGLPAESYLDTGNRAAFESGGDLYVLRPVDVRSGTTS